MIKISNPIKKAAAVAMVPLMIVALASGTAISAETASIDEVKVGQSITLVGIYLPGKTIIALEIEAENSTPDTIRYLAGAVESVDPETNSLVVMGTKIMVSKNTMLEMGKIRAPKVAGQKRKTLVPSRPMEYSEFKVNWWVEAEGPMNADGSLDAGEITAQESREVEVELEGEVEAVDVEKNRLTVMGFNVIINNRTIIEVE